MAYIVMAYIVMASEKTQKLLVHYVKQFKGPIQFGCVRFRIMACIVMAI